MINQQIINIGSNPNDGTGDPLRVAFDKVNNNFSNLFQTYVNTSSANTTGNTPGQVIFQTPANTMSQGLFFIKSSSSTGPESQNIQLFTQVDDSNSNVAFTAYGSTFFGNAIANYDMIQSGGNIQIIVNPLTSANMTHLINSQIMWAG